MGATRSSVCARKASTSSTSSEKRSLQTSGKNSFTPSLAAHQARCKMGRTPSGREGGGSTSSIASCKSTSSPSARGGRGAITGGQIVGCILKAGSPGSLLQAPEESPEGASENSTMATMLAGAENPQQPPISPSETSAKS